MPTSRGPRSESPAFGPAASLEALRARAALLTRIRSFFAERGVLEVETPALSRRAVTDVHLASFATAYTGPLPGSDLDTAPIGGGGEPTLPLYLVTSPELAMKRLLAAGSGPIYQLARAFRDGERGRLHNPEFTLLEWYRPGYDGPALQQEVAELLATVAGAGPACRRTYGELVEEAVGIDPHRAELAAVRAALERVGVIAAPTDDVDAALQLLFSVAVEPLLATERDPVIVVDYPRGQAALARLRPAGAPDAPPVAERFEVYWRGIELANGFHELTDAVEQRRRFERDRDERRWRGLPYPPADERFLAALEAGLPDGSGVALGVDRLLMVILGAGAIDQVLAFPLERA